MYKLCRINLEHSKEIINKVKELVSEMKIKLPVKEVYLYGSFAKNEIHEGSDIDLIIIGDFKERFFDRIGKILELTDLPIEPIVYTPEEFDELNKSQNPFITEVLKTAIKL
ncbi:MAG: nucleotidyltransferase domain-containing protein [Thermodesulfovibrio sp.]|uniref:nucleotidyltransferase domain-containing protein n=1 Tax=unclassified Thermodesulfovibrio TaxID=2645936 RepID=UPI00083ACA3C|nr:MULTISPECIES: nucleotidyltransferase domain-containing protein [unclassified Thermodesulfovibrio]MDI6714655.1 nucleotidyltransferase domain-containing protein [Thermodesulfovibrio sp.]